MSGSSAPTRRLPRPPELIVRALLASLLVLAVAYRYQRPLVEPLVPVFSRAAWWLSTEFTMTSAEIVPNGANEVICFRANLSLPIEYAGQTFYPFGWNGEVPSGGFQVTRAVGSVLEYGALMLIVILAWPARRVLEMIIRLTLSVPLLALLLLLDVPFSVVADLWNLLREQFAPQSFSGWVVWSRFLMGGGGLVLACVFAAVAIAAAQRITSRLIDPRQPPGARETGRARLVLPRRLEVGRNDTSPAP